MPQFGSLVLYVVLVFAAATFAVSVAAAAHPRLLRSARLFSYATFALIALDVVILAYCFQTNDFSVRYVMRYSDRSMPWYYLFTALWGGQDGSLLWWTFLLAVFGAACVRWMKGRFFTLQPWVIATVMVTTLFFVVVMAFAANPFETSWSGVPPDGQGLNPLLQNFYMTIHPPSLYVGFVGCTIPFAFAIGALISGRLDPDWLVACRRWLLFAWMFLSIGNILGALWAYEELGWGGYWAWDPVENAAFMPWLVCTAFVHSVMIQERRGMLKVWNVFLPIATFLMTIFGTFLTRSGLISSVHSFAQSGIGIFFVYFLVATGLGSLGLIIWRLPKLKAEHSLESLASREAVFLFNNWILLAAMVVILVLSVFPLLTEAISNQKVTVGPNFFTFFMIPIALVLVVLMGVGTVIPWRKANASGLWAALMWPTVAGVAAGLALIFGGKAIGFPPYADILPDVIESVHIGWFRAVLRALYGVTPVSATVGVVFSLAVVVQEFWRGIRLRRHNTKENAAVATWNLVVKARRRYGGYLVHVGFIVMIFGFVGASYKTEKEASLTPGQSLSLWDYRVTYEGIETKVDPGKRMVFARLAVERGGKKVAVIRPAKFVYRSHPDMPTTEMWIMSSIRDDLDAILGSADERTQTITLKLIVNPLVPWVWAGSILLLIGTIVAIWPDPKGVRVGAPRGRPAAAAAAALLLLLVAPTSAQAQDHDTGSSAPPPVGSVQMGDRAERVLFGQLLCPCGDCARLPLSTCTCSVADDLREQVRERLSSGQTNSGILTWYESRYGSEHLATPPSRGFARMVWVIPPVAVVVGAGGVFWLVRRWRRAGRAIPAAKPGSATGSEAAADDEYTRRLEQELRDDD